MSLDELLQAARAGGPREVTLLFEAIERRLHVFFRTESRNWDVDDLVQDSLVVVVRRLDTFEPAYPGALEEFVVRVADFVLRTRQRAWARERERRVAKSPLLVASMRMTSMVHRRKLLSEVWREIEALATMERRTVLAWIRGELRREAAEQGIVMSTMRTRVHRMFERLRRRVRRPQGVMPRSIAPTPT